MTQRRASGGPRGQAFVSSHFPAASGAVPSLAEVARQPTATPEAQHKALVEYVLMKEAAKPSRLRAECSHRLQRMSTPGAPGPQSPAALTLPLGMDPRPSTCGLSNGLMKSNSSPSLPSPNMAASFTSGSWPRSPGGQSSEDMGSRKASRASPPKLDNFFDSRPTSSAGTSPQGALDMSCETVASRNNHHPHPSSHRGSLRLTGPAQAALGVDPIHFDVEHKCDFYARKRSSHDDHRPRTPTKSMKWRSQDDWNNTGLHHPLKVGHVAPSPKGSTLTAEMLVQCPHTSLRKSGSGTLVTALR